MRTTLASLIAITALVLCLILIPFPLGPRGPVNGDTAFAQKLKPYLTGTHRTHVSTALVDPQGAVTYAAWGADEHREYEIGSITKTFTAHLLADAADRGEISLDTTLGEVFPQLDQTATGPITMEQLATHTSGLPRLGNEKPMQSLAGSFLRSDPYAGITVEDMVSKLAGIEPAETNWSYSNLNFAILGQALAEVTGTDYPTLVRQRLLDPLGMDETYVPTNPGELRDGAPQGHTAQGLPAAAWTMSAYAPAGSIRSTAHDMALWAGAVTRGEAPGSAAAEPRVSSLTDKEEQDGVSPDDRQAGLGWSIDSGDRFAPEGTDAEAARAETIRWHNGGTGGFRSFIGTNSEGWSVVVLNDTAVEVDRTGGVLLSTGGDGQ